MDVVKTQLQNQRTALYRNELDCFRQILATMGVRALYRGLVPQLVGVTPVQATKLSVNDFVRSKLSSADGADITLVAELTAAGVAAVSQVVFNNPLDMVKIRLQTHAALDQPVRAVDVVRELGIRQLYTGWVACMCRDVLFMMIFFPSYTQLKRLVGAHTGYVCHVRTRLRPPARAHILLVHS